MYYYFVLGLLLITVIILALLSGLESIGSRRETGVRAHNPISPHTDERYTHIISSLCEQRGGEKGTKITNGSNM